MTWLAEFRSHPAWDALAWVFLALLALALRQLAHRSRLARRFDGPLSLIAFGIFVGGLAILARLAGFASATPYLDAVILGALAIGGVRVVLTVFVESYLSRRESALVSAIFRDIASIVVYFVVIIVVLRTTLDINVASLVATSAVLTAIIGLALQDLLSNLLSGLVIELESPFSPGDWIRVGTFEGTVEETGWRTTKVRTRINEIVTLPNAMLSKEPVVNYSRPDPLYGDTLRFEAAYEAPPNLVKETLMHMLSADAQVASAPQPEVRVDRYNDSGVGYAVRYWITEFGELERIRDRLMTNLWYALRRAGIRIPFPARDLFVYTGTEGAGVAPAPDIARVLRGVSFLAPLDDGELAHLAVGVRRQSFGCGELVVHAGDVGDLFYVIERGVADVVLDDGAQTPVLDQLHAADFFGEMSLLAGEPRTASVRAATDLVVLVVDREAFRDIIMANPALLAPLSELVARRHAAQHERRLAGMRSVEPIDMHAAHGIRERIRRFLGL